MKSEIKKLLGLISKKSRGSEEANIDRKKDKTTDVIINEASKASNS